MQKTERKIIPLLEAREGTDLEQAMAEYYDAKAQKKYADERYDAAKDRIKLMAMDARNSDEDTRVDVTSVFGRVNVTYVEQNRFDSKRLRADNPALYVLYTKKSGGWQVRESDPNYDD